MTNTSLEEITQEELDRVMGYVHRSWGRERLAAGGLQAEG